MALLKQCFCYSLRQGSFIIGSYSLVVYCVAFAVELWWIVESLLILPAPAYTLCALYFFNFIIAAVLLFGLLVRQRKYLMSWTLMTVLSFFPEAGMVLFMSLYYWGSILKNLLHCSDFSLCSCYIRLTPAHKFEYGVIELVYWSLRAIFNIFGALCVCSLYLTWRDEELILGRLHDLTLASVESASNGHGVLGGHSLGSGILRNGNGTLKRSSMMGMVGLVALEVDVESGANSTSASVSGPPTATTTDTSPDSHLSTCSSSHCPPQPASNSFNAEASRLNCTSFVNTHSASVTFLPRLSGSVRGQEDALAATSPFSACSSSPPFHHGIDVLPLVCNSSQSNRKDSLCNNNSEITVRNLRDNSKPSSFHSEASADFSQDACQTTRWYLWKFITCCFNRSNDDSNRGNNYSSRSINFNSNFSAQSRGSFAMKSEFNPALMFDPAYRKSRISELGIAGIGLEPPGLPALPPPGGLHRSRSLWNVNNDDYWNRPPPSRPVSMGYVNHIMNLDQYNNFKDSSSNLNYNGSMNNMSLDRRRGWMHMHLGRRAQSMDGLNHFYRYYGQNIIANHNNHNLHHNWSKSSLGQESDDIRNYQDIAL